MRRRTRWSASQPSATRPSAGTPGGPRATAAPGSPGAIVRRAAGLADLVFVTAHIGGEGSDHTHVRPGPEVFLGEQRGNPIALAHAVIDAGADLVAMHWPHVLRALEWYRGRLID